MKYRLGGVEPYLYILPYFLIFAFLLVIPGVSGMIIGLYDWAVVGDRTFIGLGNFKEMFTDEVFLHSVRNTLVYALIYVPLYLVGGLAVASLLNRQFRGRSLMRLIIFAPYVFMIPAIGVIWRWFMDTNFGILNYYLSVLHLPTVRWLTDTKVVLNSIVMVILWETIGYSMVIFLAGLQEIPQEIIEAATIDGASAWSKFWNITIPFLRPTTFFILVIGVIGALKTFGQPFMITAGGPLDASMTVVMTLYYNGFQYFRMGYAAAISTMLFVGILAITLLQFRFLRQRVVE